MALKRDPDKIRKLITKRDGAFYADSLLTIEFPSWYADKGLYRNEDIHFLYGIFAIVSGDSYSVSVIPTVVTTLPVSVTEIDRDGETYIQLTYAKGDKILQSDKAIMQPFLVYNFFDGFFLQAKIPWYIEYEDMVTLMDNTVSYGGTNMGRSHISNELLTSFIARSNKDRSVFYRLNPVGIPSYVDLMDVRFSSLSTVNKLAGNYFDESLVSALITKEDKPTTLEKHVRN